MTATQLTKSPTEADLEAEIHGAIRKAFPWIPSNAIRHQTKFSFKFGHATIHVDGVKDLQAEGRIDILVNWGETPLAVLELKRNSLALAEADIEQGLSYASVIRPRYPIVVVTNGDDTRVLDSYSEADLSSGSVTEMEFQKLIAATSKAAARDLKNAVSTLMGSNASIWMQAVRGASKAHIDELCGAWNDPLRPFVRDFLIPRKASQHALTALRDNRFLLIEGAPLVGKSSLFRDIVQRTENSDDTAVLFVSADNGGGILQAVADLLSSALTWPVTPTEARSWLMRLSKAEGPSLVIAVDGVGLELDQIRHDLEDLSSPNFGEHLRIAVTADDAVAQRLKMHPKGRQASALGLRLNALISLSLLDDEEFGDAVQALRQHRMAMMPGSHSAPELRVPWILRALGGRHMPQPEEQPGNLAALPPQLSLELIRATRERFADDELRRIFREIARAVLADAGDTTQSIGLMLEAMVTFVARRRTLKQFLEPDEIERLVKQGYLKPVLSNDDDAVLFVRLPELLASEASIALASQLDQRVRKDSAEAAKWLVALTSRIPLGDVIAAHAVVDAFSSDSKGFPMTFLSSLIETTPSLETVQPGTKASAFVAGIGAMDITFQDGGSLIVEVEGRRHIIEPSSDEGTSQLVGDFHPWLVLSHLAGLRLGVEHEGELLRFDLALLAKVGSCPHVLRRPGDLSNASGVMTYDVPGYGEVACPANGIVEPITYSLFKFLSSEGPRWGDWMQEALDEGSLALLTRIYISLREVEKLSGNGLRSWAQRILTEHVNPSLNRLLQSPEDSPRLSADDLTTSSS